LVEQPEKNGLNKEIRRRHSKLSAAVNRWLTMFAQEAVTTIASPSGASTTLSPQAWARSRV
jgi:hypothetical protein